MGGNALVVAQYNEGTVDSLRVEGGGTNGAVGPVVSSLRQGPFGDYVATHSARLLPANTLAGAKKSDTIAIVPALGLDRSALARRRPRSPA